MKPLSVVLLFIFLPLARAVAQRALPGFVVQELVKGKTQISWINPYADCIQLAVQRSTNSDRNFQTIFSAQSPELPANGYVDTRVPAGVTAYYRIFYVLKDGNYFFSKPQTTGSRRLLEEDDERIKVNGNITLQDLPEPASILIYKRGEPAFQILPADYKRFRDSVIYKTKDSLYKIDPARFDWRPFIPGARDYVNVYYGDTLLLKLEMQEFRRFKDSVNAKTKDTVYSINTHRASFHPFIDKPVWVPSLHVFTNDKGYLSIHLPLAGQLKYRIVFYELNGAELFQIRSVKEPLLILDKSNFIHAGWFEFELYENEKLKEKNRFCLQKD